MTRRITIKYSSPLVWISLHLQTGVWSFMLMNNDKSMDKIFNEYVGFIVGFPGARFSCTLSTKSINLQAMINEINMTLKII